MTISNYLRIFEPTEHFFDGLNETKRGEYLKLLKWLKDNKDKEVLEWLYIIGVRKIKGMSEYDLKYRQMLILRMSTIN